MLINANVIDMGTVLSSQFTYDEIRLEDQVSKFKQSKL